jgi:hypothetical protein
MREDIFKNWSATLFTFYLEPTLDWFRVMYQKEGIQELTIKSGLLDSNSPQ